MTGVAIAIGATTATTTAEGPITLQMTGAVAIGATILLMKDAAHSLLLAAARRLLRRARTRSQRLTNLAAFARLHATQALLQIGDATTGGATVTAAATPMMTVAGATTGVTTGARSGANRPLRASAGARSARSASARSVSRVATNPPPTTARPSTRRARISQCTSTTHRRTGT